MQRQHAHAHSGNLEEERHQADQQRPGHRQAVQRAVQQGNQRAVQRAVQQGDQQRDTASEREEAGLQLPLLLQQHRGRRQAHLLGSLKEDLDRLVLDDGPHDVMLSDWHAHQVVDPHRTMLR